jgi:mitochondrial fission protein ELM1
MTGKWMKEQLDAVFAQNIGCEFWVTTSRRTPPDVEEVVKSYPWDYSLIYSLDKFNPIPAFVALAKKIYVTAESTGMISESCIAGFGEVRVLDNLLPGEHKFRRFVDRLAAEGYLGGTKKVDLAPVFKKAKSLLGIG